VFFPNDDHKVLLYTKKEQSEKLLSDIYFQTIICSPGHIKEIHSLL